MSAIKIPENVKYSLLQLEYQKNIIYLPNVIIINYINCTHVIGNFHRRQTKMKS